MVIAVWWVLDLIQYSAEQGLTQVFTIIDFMHQPWRNGMELLEDAQKNKRLLSTGCEG